MARRRVRKQKPQQQSDQGTKQTPRRMTNYIMPALNVATIVAAIAFRKELAHVHLRIARAGADKLMDARNYVENNFGPDFSGGAEPTHIPDYREELGLSRLSDLRDAVGSDDDGDWIDNPDYDSEYE